MTEAELQRAVIELARLLGYRCAHFGIGLSRKGWRTPARADAAGFPDLVLVGRGRVLWRELKAGRNRLTVEQADWLDALGRTERRRAPKRPPANAELRRDSA